MIVYENDRWLRVVFSYAGSVWPDIRKPFLTWTAFAIVCYTVIVRFDLDLGDEGKTLFGTAMSFLLVLRANEAYLRYWLGMTCTTNFFAELRSFLMLSLLHVSGGKATRAWLQTQPRLCDQPNDEDADDAKAREFRVDIVRLTLAAGVMLQLYTRIGFEGYCFGTVSAKQKWLIDFDRLRLRQLLKDDEFRLADACLGIVNAGDGSAQALAQQFLRAPGGEGPPSSWPAAFQVDLQPKVGMHVCVFFYLREVLFASRKGATGEVSWGVKDRFLPTLSGMLGKAQENYEMITQIIETPLPLPYACLCKTLMLMWMMSFPLVVNYQLGFFGGLFVPVLIVFALLGLDAVCVELENPFGGDPNDLDLLPCVSTLESEAMEFLELCGDSRARAQFVWRRVPDCVSRASCKLIHRHLAWSAVAMPEVVPSRSNSTASSHRSGRRSGSRSASASEASSQG